MSSLSEIIRQKAIEIGFDLVGFSKAKLLSEEGQKLSDWINKNYHAGMHWIKRTFQKRVSPFEILKEAKSIIALGLNYYQKGDFNNERNVGKISCYAWGQDYHIVIEQKMDLLIKFIKELQPESKNIAYVDYGPTMDKAWAIRSGLGWLGKHTLVINTSFGSWFFIGIIISSIELDKYDESISDLCGSCNLCIEACPTNAIIHPYVLDSNLCISYQTIENKSEIPQHLKGKFENYVFGCDICQLVCPWNIKLQAETNEEAFASNTIKELNFEAVNFMSEEEFLKKFKLSPIRRAKLKGLKRNFKFVFE